MDAAQKRPGYPADQGCDGLGGTARRCLYSGLGTSSQGQSTDRSAVDSASKGQPESPSVGDASSGLLGGPMRTWSTIWYGRASMDMPVVRHDWDAQSSSFPPWCGSGEAEASPEVPAKSSKALEAIGTGVFWLQAVAGITLILVAVTAIVLVNWVLQHR